MITKTKLIETLDDLPEQFSIDELVQKLKMIAKIERGALQSKDGVIMTEKELDEDIEKWFE